MFGRQVIFLGRMEWLNFERRLSPEYIACVTGVDHHPMRRGDLNSAELHSGLQNIESA